MLFNSYEYIFFFMPITFAIFFFLNSQRLILASKGFLVLASLFFYSWWNISYLPLILVSILINYAIGGTLAKKENGEKKLLTILVIGILFNLGLLGYFKYSDFLISNVNKLCNTQLLLLNLTLPLAISFFTFQQIAYLVDSYKGYTREYDFLNYAVFVAFFPQLIAGPIVHHKEVMPQFLRLRNSYINYKNIATGLFIFSLGFFKKVVLADTFAIWATNGFDKSISLHFIDAWITSLSYSFQLYFDFSGYSDMAIGVAMLFNIHLPANFNSPFKAVNIQDFWRRWHMTLSRFLRDYVYIPLGGSKKSRFNTCRNVFITFVIGGIWHGAGWTFLFWGTLHGIAIILYLIWTQFRIKLPPFISWLLTFNFVNMAFVFFRAQTWNDAVRVLKGMAGLNGIVIPARIAQEMEILQRVGVTLSDSFSQINGSARTLLWLIAGLIISCALPKNSTDYGKKLKLGYANLLFGTLLFFVSALHLSMVSEFLYFNF